MKRLFLPQRRQRQMILKNLGLDFEIIPSDYDETLETFDFSYKKIENLAYNKAKDVLVKCKGKNCIIVSADTVVVLGGRILGKPEDEMAAFKMLKKPQWQKTFCRDEYLCD